MQMHTCRVQILIVLCIENKNRPHLVLNLENVKINRCKVTHIESGKKKRLIHEDNAHLVSRPTISRLICTS